MQTLKKTLRLMRPPKLSRRLPRKRPVIAGRKTLFPMKGGPISELRMHCHGTLAFRLGEWRGYYDSKNEWVAL